MDEGTIWLSGKDSNISENNNSNKYDYTIFTSKLPKHPNAFQRIIYEVDKQIYEEYGISFAVERYIRYLSIDELYDTELIILASNIAASGFRRKLDTLRFLASQWLNAMNLKDNVITGKFRPKFFTKRTINERGKPREIKPPQFECKVAQKVICNLMLRPTLEHRMIQHNNGSCTGRGTDKLYSDVLKHVNRSLKRYGKSGVIVITDFSGYFKSIDREGLLHKQYRKLFKDPCIADFLISFDAGEEGLTLGNETSQIPASAFASPIDHFFKDRMRIKAYDRYMDDTLAVLANNDDADRYIRLYKKQATKLGLSLVKRKNGQEIDKVQKIPLGNSFVFCKERYVFSEKEDKYYMLPNPDRARNVRRKIKAYSKLVADGKMDKKEAETIINATIKSIEAHPNTKRAVEDLIFSAIAEEPVEDGIKDSMKDDMESGIESIETWRETCDLLCN